MSEFWDSESSSAPPVFEFYNPSELNCPSCPEECKGKTNEIFQRIFNLEKDLKSSLEVNEALREEHVEEIQSFRDLLTHMGVYEKQDLEDEVHNLKQENELLKEDMTQLQEQIEHMDLDGQNLVIENSEFQIRIQGLEAELNLAEEENQSINGRLIIQLDVSKELASKLHDKEAQISRLYKKVNELEKKNKENDTKIKEMESEKESLQNASPNDLWTLKILLIAVLVFTVAFLITRLF